MKKKIPVAIIGTGNIGSDLLVKIMHSNYLTCTLFAGKNPNSSGIARAKGMGVPTSSDSIDALLSNPHDYKIVFDATSAASHRNHAPILKKLKKFVIDMTPSRIGIMCVPVLNIEKALRQQNVNMISCGAQAASPLAYAVRSVHRDIEYIELISSIASKSAGIGTRDNIDEYTESTRDALEELGKVPKAKAIVILNPAEPPIIMHNTLFLQIPSPDIEAITRAVHHMVKKIKRYVPQYELTLGPIIENGRVTIMTEVRGSGDFLPEYAGNLDIINCSAIAVAERWAVNRTS